MPDTPTSDVTPVPAPSPVSNAGQVTELLRAWGAGDARASESLVRLIYEELRRQAQLALRREHANHTLQPTALVHEAWLRLGRQHGAPWESRTQFFAIAAQMMRRVLLDYARSHRAGKRGGGAVQVSLSEVDHAAIHSGGPHDRRESLDPVDVIALNDALERLTALDPQKARLVDLRYFVGLSIPEAAKTLGVSTATVGREWAIARMWLRRELER